jgi:hypothetical protein
MDFVAKLTVLATFLEVAFVFVHIADAHGLTVGTIQPAMLSIGTLNAAHERVHVGGGLEVEFFCRVVIQQDGSGFGVNQMPCGFDDAR